MSGGEEKSTSHLHYFHSVCLNTWFNVIEENDATCPFCISNIEEMRVPLSELVALNLDVNLYNIDYLTTLMWADCHGHAEVVNQLIALKLDINIQDNDGRTELMLAIRYGLTDVVKELLLLSVNANLKNNRKQTAMDLANDEGYVHIIQVLTEYCKGNQK